MLINNQNLKKKVVFIVLISGKKLNILFTSILGLGAGLAQGLVETGSPREALKYVNFKVLSGKNQFIGLIFLEYRIYRNKTVKTT